MRVFIYEYFTALGIGREPNSVRHGIFREGRAMRDSVAEDFGRVAGVSVFAFPDDAAPVERDDFLEKANDADWTLVIAPESDDVLTDLAELVWPSGSRFLGPSAKAIRLTADKLALAERWLDCDVPTPATSDREPNRCEAFPVVWKPRDGAGSAATFQMNSPLDVPRMKATREAEQHAGPMILQEFVPGQSVSVAFLCGPAGNMPLLPAAQLLSDDGRFKYLGGELPIAPALAERALRLARQAVGCVPGLLGYVGVDLVLGDAENGSRDFAIEINPRLTTSYVGLRALADCNLAGAMLKAAMGEALPAIQWKAGRVRFAPDGTATSA